MSVQATGAMAIIVADVPAGSPMRTMPDIDHEQDPARALFTLTILTGLVMVAAGVARLGSVLRFVSNAVMVGFVSAVGPWIGVVDGIRPTMALGLGALLAGLNPKNLLLVVAGAVAITETGIPAGQQAAAYTVFAFVGSLGVAVPLVIYLATGDRAPETLARLKRWLGMHNNVITSGLCLVVAAKLVSDAVPALVG